MRARGPKQKEIQKRVTRGVIVGKEVRRHGVINEKWQLKETVPEGGAKGSGDQANRPEKTRKAENSKLELLLVWPPCR